jgi:hypothetical protein
VASDGHFPPPFSFFDHFFELVKKCIQIHVYVWKKISLLDSSLAIRFQITLQRQRQVSTHYVNNYVRLSRSVRMLKVCCNDELRRIYNDVTMKSARLLVSLIILALSKSFDSNRSVAIFKVISGCACMCRPTTLERKFTSSQEINTEKSTISVLIVFHGLWSRRR